MVVNYKEYEIDAHRSETFVGSGVWYYVNNPDGELMIEGIHYDGDNNIPRQSVRDTVKEMKSLIDRGFENQ